MATPLDINAATEQQIIDALEGIGPSRAAAILDWRDRHGYMTQEDFISIPEIPASVWQPLIKEKRIVFTVEEQYAHGEEQNVEAIRAEFLDREQRLHQQFLNREREFIDRQKKMEEKQKEMEERQKKQLEEWELRAKLRQLELEDQLKAEKLKLQEEKLSRQEEKLSRQEEELSRRGSMDSVDIKPNVPATVAHTQAQTVPQPKPTEGNGAPQQQAAMGTQISAATMTAAT